MTGEANLQLDGVAAHYVLFTGLFSDTRFADPAHATIYFQPERNTNARLVVMLDATRTGLQMADGRSARVEWIADGGQVFPQKTSCVVQVTSPYSGTPQSVFSGEIANCVVYSAGNDHTLSSVRFSMTGAPKR